MLEISQKVLYDEKNETGGVGCAGKAISRGTITTFI